MQRNAVQIITGLKCLPSKARLKHLEHLNLEDSHVNVIELGKKMWEACCDSITYLEKARGVGGGGINNQ